MAVGLHSHVGADSFQKSAKLRAYFLSGHVGARVELGTRFVADNETNMENGAGVRRYEGVEWVDEDEKRVLPSESAKCCHVAACRRWPCGSILRVP